MPLNPMGSGYGRHWHSSPVVSPGPIGPNHFELAVVVELIHAATLVHDDILDGAEMRRGLPTVNAKWGNAISVLLGDCLFAHALKISTSFPNGEVSRRIAHAAADVCRERSSRRNVALT
jgi:octaprenyl-diphosphate synthase